MTRVRSFISVLVLTLAAAPVQAQVVNGGFELPDFDGSFMTYGPGSTQLTGWVVDGAGIVHAGTFWQHASGRHSVELNFFASGGISQSVSTVPGVPLLLEFDMAGQTDVGPAVKELQVFWDSAPAGTFTFDVTGHSNADMGWSHRSVVLPGPSTTSTALRFFGSVPANGDGGPALDNVSLSPVPEPGALGLVSLALAGAACRPRGRAARYAAR